ncbi:hypothetical protein AC578_6868 [Pseudocercospora eumusae]|uniref:Uncharacterized protein n=1 Tax=Pseudocercospora eumusae TaxID=321146 RepID=A0A139GZ98_9PEZI|nr:hypothetical protein AC578_6868 [Pseudocercospora eumusae]
MSVLRQEAWLNAWQAEIISLPTRTVAYYSTILQCGTLRCWESLPAAPEYRDIRSGFDGHGRAKVYKRYLMDYSAKP